MVKNKALGKYVNDTLKKIDSLCQQNDNCNTYIRGEVKEKTRLRPPPKKVKPKPPPEVKPKPLPKVKPKKVKPKPPPEVKPKLKNNIKEITDFKACAGNVKPHFKKIQGKGTSFWIDLHPKEIDVHVSGAFYRGSTWENGKYDFLRQQMTPDKKFIDIGANIGTFTLQALADGYTVIAVEAFSRNTQKLCSSILKNNFKKVRLFQNAVWNDVDGTLGFDTPHDNIGGNQISTSSHDGEQVHKMLIDSVIKGVDNYVMKIDIEAAECRALASEKFWMNPPSAMTMEWGRILEFKKGLCPRPLYKQLCHNISKHYGQDLTNFKGWDAPNLIRKH